MVTMGVHVYWPITISTCFKLIIIQVQTNSLRDSFCPSLTFCDFDVLVYIFMPVFLLSVVVIIAFIFFCFLIYILTHVIFNPCYIFAFLNEISHFL